MRYPPLLFKAQREKKETSRNSHEQRSTSHQDELTHLQRQCLRTNQDPQMDSDCTLSLRMACSFSQPPSGNKVNHSQLPCCLKTHPFQGTRPHGVLCRSTPFNFGLESSSGGKTSEVRLGSCLAMVPAHHCSRLPLQSNWSRKGKEASATHAGCPSLKAFLQVSHRREKQKAAPSSSNNISNHFKHGFEAAPATCTRPNA